MSQEKIVAAIVAERKRQIEEEGHTPNDDDQYNQGSAMALAAAAYAISGAGDPLVNTRNGRMSLAQCVWPWKSKMKPKDRDFDLIRACALLIAELERRERTA